VVSSRLNFFAKKCIFCKKVLDNLTANHYINIMKTMNGRR